MCVEPARLAADADLQVALEPLTAEQAPEGERPGEAIGAERGTCGDRADNRRGPYDARCRVGRAELHSRNPTGRRRQGTQYRLRPRDPNGPRRERRERKYEACPEGEPALVRGLPPIS